MRPTKAEALQLQQMADARRFVYNWVLGRRKEYYATTGETISLKMLSAELTQLKRQPGREWIASADAQSLQQALQDADRAYQNFFRNVQRNEGVKGKKGFPRFKSRHTDTPRFRLPQRVTISDGKVRIPKIGRVRIRQSREIEGVTKSASFKRDASGKWYVTIVSEFEIPDVMPITNTDDVIGIDLGIKSFAVLSDGTVIDNPKFYRKAEKKLARAQKKLSRTKRRSANRTKARRKVARIHARIANQRNDFLHQLTTRLVRTYSGFCIEDLNIEGMLHNHKLAKSIGDAAFGEFRRQLEYKARWALKPVAVIDRWFPSSRMCDVCGAINNNLTLKDREWVCACGKLHYRDATAAQNIREEGIGLLIAAGHAEMLNACGASVSPCFGMARGDETRIPPR
jgi:putative transposase